MSTLYEKEEINRVLNKTKRTDKEKEDAAKAQETIKAAKKLNNLATGLHAGAAGAAAVKGGVDVSKLVKINKNIKELEKLIKKENSKIKPNKETLNQLITELNTLKATRVKYITSIGYDAAVVGSYLYKTGKGAARAKKIDNIDKDLELQKKVVATYDKDGVREESTLYDNMCIIDAYLTEAANEKDINN